MTVQTMMIGGSVWTVRCNGCGACSRSFATNPYDGQFLYLRVSREEKWQHNERFGKVVHRARELISEDYCPTCRTEGKNSP